MHARGGGDTAEAAGDGKESIYRTSTIFFYIDDKIDVLKSCVNIGNKYKKREDPSTTAGINLLASCQTKLRVNLCYQI